VSSADLVDVHNVTASGMSASPRGWPASRGLADRFSGPVAVPELRDSLY
jgi:hypothetical protein